MPAPNVIQTNPHNFNVALPNGETIQIGQSTYFTDNGFWCVLDSKC